MVGSRDEHDFRVRRPTENAMFAGWGLRYLLDPCPSYFPPSNKIVG